MFANLKVLASAEHNENYKSTEERKHSITMDNPSTGSLEYYLI